MDKRLIAVFIIGGIAAVLLDKVIEPAIVKPAERAVEKVLK